ncbi:hypothetical protein ACFQ5M_07615 [Agrilactobacillus yilanensis]|uniref:Uncharacterized protein n=1 Tax=Agrilactobacillus yilanensis TaxID=2485997 RepID=A0ABW4J6X2_9LACO|nr:hypothetical protein [Agrilactobacillus yilanensis]
MATAQINRTALLDKSMSEVFDWSDSKTPVRDALWDHFMEANKRDTLKTESALEPFMTASDDKIKAYVEANLKK